MGEEHSEMGYIILHILCPNQLIKFGMYIRVVQRPHGAAQPGGIQDQQGEDSQ